MTTIKLPVSAEMDFNALAEVLAPLLAQAMAQPKTEPLPSQEAGESSESQGHLDKNGKEVFGDLGGESVAADSQNSDPKQREPKTPVFKVKGQFRFSVRVEEA